MSVSKKAHILFALVHEYQESKNFFQSEIENIISMTLLSRSVGEKQSEIIVIAQLAKVYKKGVRIRVKHKRFG